ncbi:hypothetical protein [Pseudonocardia spirodelae]|uniref:Uncharacterized protein n=1 Tax=Pseudonocardia spirodelae TaxID=3133431 RepID=A0ABU8T932_9PSEU
MSGSGSVVLRTVAWCAGVLLAGAAVLVAVVAGFGAFVAPAEARSDRDVDPVTAFTRLAADDPAAALRSCTPARGTDVDALAGALPAGAVPGSERFVVADGDLTFVSAPITGTVRGAGDRAVWAWGRQGFAAVTDDARALTPELPGPAVYGTGPDAAGAVRVATCVEAAQRAARSGAARTQGPVAPVR